MGWQDAPVVSGESGGSQPAWMSAPVVSGGTPKSPPKEPDPTLSGRIGAVADIAGDVASGALQQVVGIPKHLGALAQKITSPLNRATPEQKAKETELAAQPGITEKIQGLLSTHKPQTEEEKFLLGKIQNVLKPLTAVGQAVRKGSEAVIGKEATDVASDVLGLAGLKSAGTASTAAKALKSAESTQSKVTKIIDNLGGGRSLEKADVGQAAGQAIGATTAAAKKAGSNAYEDLSVAFGSDTPVGLNASKKAADTLGSRVIVDPSVAAFSKKLNSVNAMTFEDLKDLRTQISDSMGSDRNVNRQLRELRDAVTKDIEDRATQLSPEAKKLWDTANAKWKEYVKTQDRINRVLGKNWEGKTSADLYNKLVSAATKDPQKIQTVVDSIRDPGVKRQFAASVLHHMANTGGEFNGDKFVTQWDRMNPQARKVLFDSVGGNYEQNMTRLVQNLKRIREGKTGLIKEVSGIGVAAILAHFFPGGTAAVGAVTLGREAYKFGPKAIEAYLTSPQIVRTLAERTTAALQRGAAAGVVATQQATPPTLESMMNTVQPSSTLANAPQ